MPLPKASLRNLAADHHGGLNYARLRMEGISPDEVLDFSVNTNPFGAHPAVGEALRRVVIQRYPDPDAGELRERLAELNQVSPGQVLVTNGTAQAIWLLALVYLETGDPVLIVSPTFGEYRVASRLMGARVHLFFGREEDGFRPDVDALVKWIGAHRPRLVWLCTPNNPTGVYLEQGEVQPLLSACERIGGMLVLDEAYVNFTARPWDSVPMLAGGHLVLLRSMTKDYALAGLRLGYLLSTIETVGALRRAQPPWSVNAAAQVAGLAALDHLDFYQDTWSRLRTLTDELYATLLERGFHALPTATNFLLVRTGDGDQTREQLWRYRILVRSCRSFGLPAYIRIGTRLEAENARLLQCLEEIRH